MERRTSRRSLPCFAIMECGPTGLALEIAEGVAAVLAGKGLRTLLAQQGNDGDARGKWRAYFEGRHTHHVSSLVIVLCNAAFGKEAHRVRDLGGDKRIPCLYAIKRDDANQLGTLSRLIRDASKRCECLQPTAFVVSSYDLELAARLSRRCKLPSWGDPANIDMLAERILSCTMD